MTEQESNLYNAPQSDIKTIDDDGFTEVKIFSFKGRIGRLRFIAYNLSMIVPVMILVGLLSTLAGSVFISAGGDPMTVSIIVIAAPYLFTALGTVIFTVRRVNDFNYSGWLTLLLLLPVVNVIFGIALWLIPGTIGENKYGQEPEKNGLGVFLVGIVMPVLIVVIFVAIAYSEIKGLG